MKRSVVAVLGVPLLVGLGLLLSACARTVDHGPTPVFAYGMPYGSVDLIDWQ
jgi:hypothetical protein